MGHLQCLLDFSITPIEIRHFSCFPHSSGEKRFRVFLRDHQKLQGRLLRLASPLFPAAHCVCTDIEVLREHRLAGVELAANAANLFWGDRFGRGGDHRQAQILSFTLPVFLDLFECPFQFAKNMRFDSLAIHESLLFVA